MTHSAVGASAVDEAWAPALIAIAASLWKGAVFDVMGQCLESGGALGALATG